LESKFWFYLFVQKVSDIVIPGAGRAGTQVRSRKEREGKSVNNSISIFIDTFKEQLVPGRRIGHQCNFFTNAATDDCQPCKAGMWNFAKFPGLPVLIQIVQKIQLTLIP
jgi:hypothetical protein